MYEEHSKIDTPPDDTVIWRYMNLEKLLALLRSRSLYLCRLDRLRDPWEGLWSPWAVDAIRQQLRGQAEGLIRAQNMMKRLFYVSCWHENSCESAAFWDQYQSSRGLAVRSTVGHLKDSSCLAPRFFIGRVQYLNSLVSGKVLYDGPQVLCRQKDRANFSRERFETKNGELGGGGRSGLQCHNWGCIPAASCSRN
jgi:hypothetical protein